MVYDVTERVAEAHEYFDKFLDERILEISRISEVPVENFVKINPAEFIEKNKNQTIRASKCECLPCPRELALDFFIRNHRQSAPLVRETAVCFGLVFRDELVAVMLYDIANGAVRGKKKDYELVRLSISKGTRIHGGASKLQTACEETLREMGVSEIFSYSNATINSGAVYEKLGFAGSKVEGGQPFVIMRNNTITRLINLYPNSTDKKLAQNGWLKMHLGGNKMWKKKI